MRKLHHLSDVLQELGPHLVVPFAVKLLDQPMVVWRNHRWFLANGINSLDVGVAAEVDSWLLKTYAVRSANAPEILAGDFDGHLVADRYGANRGATHGGSGRCGIAGAFNAKGVGRTPLVPDNVDWIHSNGRMTLEEAIRDAICSEIAVAEQPFGAVPIVAIIDTGEYVTWEDAAGGERTAIVVRPNFIRLAHFQRSIFFGTSGFEGSDQQIDALRTRDAVQWLWHRHDGDLAETLSLLSYKLLRQNAFSLVHRIWPGPFTPGNHTLDGELLDFGAFTSCSSWQRAFSKNGNGSFGDDCGQIASFFESLAFYLEKYRPTQYPPCSSPCVDTSLNHVAAELRAIVGGADVPDELRDLPLLLLSVLQDEQRIKTELPEAPGRPWLYKAFSSHKENRLSPDCLHCPDLFAIADRAPGFRGRSLALWHQLRRTIRPRPFIYRQEFRVRVQHALQMVEDGFIGLPAAVDYLFASTVTQSRRVWRLAPAELIILEQKCGLHWSTLQCFDARNANECVWAEGTFDGERVHFEGVSIAMNAVATLTHVVEDARVGVQIRSLSELQSMSSGARSVSTAEQPRPLPLNYFDEAGSLEAAGLPLNIRRQRIR